MYHFIINPKSSSGKGIRYWWSVKNELGQKEVPYVAYFTKYENHASELASQICSSNTGVKNIVVLGGDGTMNEVINGITSFDEVILGYIPSGSSNDLARSLNIPKDPIKALSNVLKPTRFKYLDHGVISFKDSETVPHKFACSSGFGYDANVCKEVQASPMKKRLNRFGAGKLIYLAIAFKQVISFKYMDATVILDGIKKDTYKNVFQVSAMIHRYEGGGLLMAPDANPCDGLLSVCLVHGLSRFKVFMLLPTIVLGKHVRFKGVETFQCTNIEIISNHIAAVHTDGEVPAICSHIKASCIPGQIRMIL